MLRVTHLLVSLLVLLPIMAIASDLKLGDGFYLTERTSQLEQANETMKSVRNADEDAALKALDKLQSFYNENKSPLLMSYVGSLKAMQARYTILPWMKLTHAKNGSKMLDKAVKKDPKNLEIRFNRFFTYIEFPSFLKKGIFIQEDARVMKAVYENGTLEEGSYAKNSVLEALASFYTKEGKKDKANEYLEQIKDPSFKSEVSARLKAL